MEISSQTSGPYSPPIFYQVTKKSDTLLIFALRDNSCLPACVDPLLSTCSQWLDISHSHGTMDGTMVSPKQNGGSSKLSRLMLLLFLTGNTRFL